MLNLLVFFENDYNSLFLDMSFMSSGNLKSNIGERPLRRRVLDSEIRNMELVKKGGFGSIWKGEYQGDLVAVKKFQSRNEESWDDEVRVRYLIYETYEPVF